MSNYIITKNGLVNADELYHYGVKGMRWGIVRSKKRLATLIDKYEGRNQTLSETQKYASDKALRFKNKANTINIKNSPHQAKLAKATAKKAEYDLKLEKQLNKRRPNAEKIAKYAAKSNKYDRKMLEQQKKIKFNKYQVKSESFQLKAENAKREIEKNQRLIDVYSKTLKEYDSEKLRRGKIFMEYMIS